MGETFRIVCLIYSCSISCAVGSLFEASSPEILYEEALVAEAELDYSRALALLQQYEHLPSANLDGVFWQFWARVSEKLEDYVQSAYAREQRFSLSPGDIWLRIDLADDWSRIGRLAEALELLSEYVPLDSSEVALIRKAQIELMKREGLLSEAAKLLMTWAENSERVKAQVYYQEASILYESAGDRANATKAISLALDEDSLAREKVKELEALQSFELGKPRSVQDARRLLFKHSNPEFRRNGINYLKRGRYPQETADYLIALRDTDVEVVRVAILMLAKIESYESLAKIKPYLYSSNRDIKLAAVRAVESLGEREDAHEVLKIVDLNDRELFRAWMHCLEKLCKHSFGANLDPNYSEREKILTQWQEYLKGDE
jgi:thioredoxin-like negative regulator of GroEL